MQVTIILLDCALCFEVAFLVFCFCHLVVVIFVMVVFVAVVFVVSFFSVVYAMVVVITILILIIIRPAL